MRPLYKTLPVAVAAVLAASVATAQFVGPGSPANASAAPSVASVIAAPVDDHRVELTGTIVRQTGHETYLFEDGTGSIEIEVDADEFPAGVAIDARTRVVIVGEVDVRWMRAPRIDVDELRLTTPGLPAAPTHGVTP